MLQANYFIFTNISSNGTFKFISPGPNKIQNHTKKLFLPWAKIQMLGINFRPKFKWYEKLVRFIFIFLTNRVINGLDFLT